MKLSISLIIIILTLVSCSNDTELTKERYEKCSDPVQKMITLMVESPNSWVSTINEGSYSRELVLTHSSGVVLRRNSIKSYSFSSWTEGELESWEVIKPYKLKLSTTEWEEIESVHQIWLENEVEDVRCKISNILNKKTSKNYDNF
jgi:hypothetical protein